MKKLVCLLFLITITLSIVSCSFQDYSNVVEEQFVKDSNAYTNDYLSDFSDGVMINAEPLGNIEITKLKNNHYKAVGTVSFFSENDYTFDYQYMAYYTINSEGKAVQTDWEIEEVESD